MSAVAWWDFFGDNKDKSGNSLDLTTTGTVVTGKGPFEHRLDGRSGFETTNNPFHHNNNYLSVDSGTKIWPGTGDLTICQWIKPTGVIQALSKVEIVFSLEVPWTPGPTKAGTIVCGFNTASWIPGGCYAYGEFSFLDNATHEEIGSESTGDLIRITHGQWNFVTHVFERGTKKQKHYVGKTLMYTGTILEDGGSGIDFSLSTEISYVGVSSGYDTYWSSLGPIKILNKGLSATEVADEYDQYVNQFFNATEGTGTYW